MRADRVTPDDAFKTALHAGRALTEEALLADMALLPPIVRDRLARGPKSRRFACGVCDAFGPEFFKSGGFDLSKPAWRVWIYHEVPKADMTHRDHLHYGELANETYRRCLATYSAAGWRGEAPEPDA